MIPMVDLKGQYHTLKQEIDNALLRALEETQFILGPNVKAFEAEAADYLGTRDTVAVASGTDALHLALLASGIGPGDEVITTAFSFVATAEAILYVGARPVFVDINPDNFNIDIEQVRAAITARTRAIIPVHLFGQPCDMMSLMALAEQHGLHVIEDCAQAFGADIQSKRVGSFATAGCFSFFPSKNLGCYGDGGLISTNNREMADHLRVLRNHGSWQRYHHTELGFNSRLDELQAVILRIKLKHIDYYNEQRRNVAQRYNQALQKLPGIITPIADGIGSHVYHQYTLLTTRRDIIARHLQEKEIASAIYYPIPLHQQTLFATDYKSTSLPHSERIAAQCLSLPIYPELDAAKQTTIITAIEEAMSD